MQMFIEIAERAIIEAEHVECELAEFRDGLREIIDVLRERLSTVNDELKYFDEGGEG